MGTEVRGLETSVEKEVQLNPKCFLILDSVEPPSKFYCFLNASLGNVPLLPILVTTVMEICCNHQQGYWGEKNMRKKQQILTYYNYRFSLSLMNRVHSFPIFKNEAGKFPQSVRPQNKT